MQSSGIPEDRRSGNRRGGDGWRDSGSGIGVWGRNGYLHHRSSRNHRDNGARHQQHRVCCQQHDRQRWSGDRPGSQDRCGLSANRSSRRVRHRRQVVVGSRGKTIGDGLVLGDGKKHPITMVFRDTQSDSNRAAQVAGDLISNNKVDILVASGAPDTVNPAADTAEAMETPLLSVFCPWSAFVFARGGSLTNPSSGPSVSSRLGASVRRHDRHLRQDADQQEGRLPCSEQCRRQRVDRRQDGAPAIPASRPATRWSFPRSTPRAPRTSPRRSASSRRRAARSYRGHARRRTSPTSGSRVCSRGSSRRSPSMALALGFPQAAAGRRPRVSMGSSGQTVPGIPPSPSRTRSPG